ncbi:MAG TPA: hypothetical protein VNG12_02670 [Acidimicrobiales bacterium]|nr:hypothetical protein [Acidimicrobiales bacterium]
MNKLGINQSDHDVEKGATSDRTHHAKRNIIVLIVALVVIGSATAAMADVSASDGGGTVTVTVSSSGSSGGSSTPGVGAGTTVSTGSGPACTYTLLSTEGVPGLASGGPTSGSWYLISCPHGGLGFVGTQVFWVPTVASVPPTRPVVVAPSAVAAQAAASIALPVPSISTNPAPFSIVNLPTWLWIDSSIWHAYSATASVGAVTATAVATPESVSWSMGDGSSSVECSGPGTPYRTDLSAASQHSSCTYTYSSPSSGPNANSNDGAYPVTATIYWTVTWTGTSGAGGTLPTLETSAGTRIRVEQIQSVDTVQ